MGRFGNVNELVEADLGRGISICKRMIFTLVDKYGICFRIKTSYWLEQGNILWKRFT